MAKKVSLTAQKLSEKAFGLTQKAYNVTNKANSFCEQIHGASSDLIQVSKKAVEASKKTFMVSKQVFTSLKKYKKLAKGCVRYKRPHNGEPFSKRKELQKISFPDSLRKDNTKISTAVLKSYQRPSGDLEISEKLRNW